ncbi:MAG: DUF1772 domain-containing protein [Alphaproteobacteria bacterium]
MAFDWIVYVCLAAGVATGLVAGVFLTFSDFMMRSLAEIPSAHGASAMAAVNRRVYGSLFLGLFLGMAVIAALLVPYAAFGLSGAAAAWIAVGGVLYLAGTFAVTVAVNVPMNKKLDRLAGSPDGDAYWRRYAVRWTRWNHVRTVAASGASICLMSGAVALGAA